jgi:hypothetical protein
MQGGARMATIKILFYSSTFYKKENKTAHSAVDKTCDVRWEAGNEDGPSSVKVVFKYQLFTTLRPLLIR